MIFLCHAHASLAVKRMLTALASVALLCNAVCAAEVDFAHEIVPIMKEHCVECHGGHRREGDFSINTREALLNSGMVVPGNASDSYLMELATSDDAEIRMPKNKPALSEGAVASLREWIDSGLPWEAGFTFAPTNYEPPLRPRRPELPPAVDGHTNPVDRILDAYLSQHGISHASALDDAAFLRRASLDITGLLPTPQRLHAFLADADPAKRDRLIDELLADDRAYAEHWFTFWNDLLRNDFQGTGYIDGGRMHIGAWLYNALLENKRYDEFVRQLISPSPESAGFIRGIKWRGSVNASQKQEIQFAQNVSQVFLGINMKCATCHDSFIDRWTLAETYGLAAINAEEPLELHRCDKPIGETATASWIFPELGQIDAAAPREERLEQLAELMTDRENGRFTRTIVNRIWHRLMGRGVVHPVDAMQTKPWNADLLDYLAIYLADHDYDLKSVLRLIISSRAYQSQAIALEQEPSGVEFVYAGPLAKRMTAEQFIDAVWQITSAGPREPHEQVAAFLPKDNRIDRTWYRASLVANDLLMRSLGRPSRDMVVSDRPAMLTTLQALDLSNSPILAVTLSDGTPNVLARFESRDRTALADWLYEYAMSREPTPQERAVALEILGSPPTRQGVEDLLWIVFMLPEFQIIR